MIVYLPGIYQKRPDLQFPVLYLEDGQNLFDPATSFIPGMYWRVGETADALIAQGAIQPLIIVGIYNTGKQRINEYTPTRDQKLGGGKADKYGRLLVEELKPFIDLEYRVLGRSANTGSRRLIARRTADDLSRAEVSTGFRQARRIVSLRLVEPPRHSGFCGQRAAHRAPTHLARRGHEGRRAHRRERHRSARHVVQEGWQEGRDLRFEMFDGAQHNEAAWAERVGPFLQFLFPAGDSAV